MKSCQESSSDFKGVKFVKCKPASIACGHDHLVTEKICERCTEENLNLRKSRVLVSDVALGKTNIAVVKDVINSSGLKLHAQAAMLELVNTQTKQEFKKQFAENTGKTYEGTDHFVGKDLIQLAKDLELDK
jgi:hypothetical protein